MSARDLIDAIFAGLCYVATLATVWFFVVLLFSIDAP